uniref:RNase III domain-containing protein n=1 Tax=viral metagenome TaxID=1070528 RepID=A0A6C0J5J0_9ZZZZ
MDTYCPYNSGNRAFGEEDIHTVLRKHGLPHYRITNRKVFQTAMVHTTYVKRLEYTTPDGRPAQLAPCPPGVMPLQDESYECLEFEGDAVLGACIATYLRKKFPEKKQGFLTDARKELVNNERIGRLCQQVGLDTFYVISRHNETSVAIRGRANIQKLGDIFEAFIGALWSDCGNRFHIVNAFVTSVMETYLDIDELVMTATNYKDLFQKVCQRELKCTPTYDMISNDPKKNEIVVAVLAAGREVGRGAGTTRKRAEQEACRKALMLSEFAPVPSDHT